MEKLTPPIEKDILRVFLIFLLVFLLLNANFWISSAEAQVVYEVPGKNQYCKIDPNGVSVLPSGRYVTPAGEAKRITRAPYGLAVSADEHWAVIAHSNAISLVDLSKDSLLIQRFPEFNGKGIDVIRGASFIGLQFLSDNKTALIGGGDKGIIWFFDCEKRLVVDSIDVGAFHPKSPREAFLTDILHDPSRNELWVLDRAWKELYRIDLKTKTLIKSFPTGRIPFGLALSEDKKTILFSNVGIYQYSLLPGVTKNNKDSAYLHFPPYGAHTVESDTGTWVNGKKVPGLGKADNDESMSVWMIDVASNQQVATIKTGLRIGEMIEDAEIVGGSHPSSLVCKGKYAYVSQTQNDNIAVIDLKKRKVVKYIPIVSGTVLDEVRGYFPYGLDVNPVDNQLYVALLGFNAVAAIDLKTHKTIGFLPAGWGATRVKFLSRKNQLLLTSARGYGAGPNGGLGFKAPPQGTYVGDIQLGLLQRITLTGYSQWEQGKLVCLQNTFTQSIQPKSSAIGGSSKIESTGSEVKTGAQELAVFIGQLPISHIVYITKENRSFDEVFAQIPGVKGDSSLARFGVNCESVIKKDIQDRLSLLSDNPLGADEFRKLLKKYVLDSLTLDALMQAKNIKITPNHQKIAKSFSLSDNFYCDSDASIHGHHWMMGTIPNEYVETNSANAGSYRLFSPAPGRIFPRTTGAQDAEDYNEIGGFWEALQRNNISVFNFGQANEYTDVQEEWYDTANGTSLAVPFPMPAAIFPYTSRKYAGYNMNIPDQFRVEQFEEEFIEKWLTGKDTMPQIVTIQLPNDHTTGPRPQDGYPFLHSYVADNDLALGRMLHFLSHTPYWKNMLVIVTEDDPQGGVDHIDAHRSLLFMAGPYVKRGYVSHTHANFGSIIKTMYTLMGIKPVNHYDLTATTLTDFFTTQPDYTPYQLEKSDVRIFDPEVAIKKYDRTIPWREVKMSEPMDDERFINKK